MRGSYNAAATQSLKAKKGERRSKYGCPECEERRTEIEEKSGVIITLHKKMECLRSELMNQNIELKTKDSRIDDIVSMLAKCEYENVKKCEDSMDELNKEIAANKYELSITKDELVTYIDKCESMRDDLDKAREVMKMETMLSSKELKDINKELVEGKLMYEKKDCELEEAKRTVGNLNTMVSDLQYVVRKLLINANSANIASDDDLRSKLKACDVKKTIAKLKEDKPVNEDETLGLARKYLEFTKKSYALRQKARDRVKGNSKVDFVFADVNCNLCLKLVNGSFIHFTSERELDEIIERLNSGQSTDSG